MTTNTSSPASQVIGLLDKSPSRPTWEKVCEVLDRTPTSELDAAITAVDEGLERWPDDLNEGHLWPLPPRQAYKVWVQKYILQGKPAPRGWSLFTFLQLHDHRFGKQGSAALFAHPGLATITHLYLAQCELGSKGVQELLESPHTGALTHLVLRGNALDAGCAAQLFTHALGQQLTMLDIGNNKLDTTDLEALLSTPMPRLTTLCIDHCEIPTEQLIRILDAETLPAIEVLALSKHHDGVDLDLARAAEGHPHIKHALWHAHLLKSDVRQLKQLARGRAIPNSAKLKRVELIAALRPQILRKK